MILSPSLLSSKGPALTILPPTGRNRIEFQCTEGQTLYIEKERGKENHKRKRLIAFMKIYHLWISEKILKSEGKSQWKYLQQIWHKEFTKQQKSFGFEDKWQRELNRAFTKEESCRLTLLLGKLTMTVSRSANQSEQKLTPFTLQLNNIF